ncbi:MAG: hypothetical protein ACREJ3_00315 [Polyangiaceae bacterium]
MQAFWKHANTGEVEGVVSEPASVGTQAVMPSVPLPASLVSASVIDASVVVPVGALLLDEHPDATTPMTAANAENPITK